MKYHDKVVHQKIKDYKCEICPKTFGNSHNLNRHVESVHGKKQIPCKLCSKTFKMESYLDIHMKIIHEPKLVKCEQCEKEFYAQRYLNIHRSTNHGENVKKVEKCPICLKSVKYLSLHQDHVHSNKYHKCTHCNKRMKLSSMSNHIKFVHKNTRTTACDICNMTFYNNAKLTRHKNSVHSEDKNFPMFYL